MIQTIESAGWWRHVERCRDYLAACAVINGSASGRAPYTLPDIPGFIAVHCDLRNSVLIPGRRLILLFRNWLNGRTRFYWALYLYTTRGCKKNSRFDKLEVCLKVEHSSGILSLESTIYLSEEKKKYLLCYFTSIFHQWLLRNPN